jgi:hypothetical protein
MAKRTRTPEAEHELRTREVEQLTQSLARARRRNDATKIANGQKELANAQRLLERASQNLAKRGKRMARKPPKVTMKSARTLRGEAVARQLSGAVGESTAPVVAFSVDPDADNKAVSIFKTGSTFHRRDCQVVESHDGAIRIPVAEAKRRALVRCMHCVPTVR